MHRTLQADQLHGPDQVSAANSWSTTGTRCTARKGTLSSQNPPPRTTPWSSRASGANARDHQKTSPLWPVRKPEGVVQTQHRAARDGQVPKEGSPMFCILLIVTAAAI